MTSRPSLPFTCSNSDFGTPWARMTSVPPSTWSARSAVRMPRSERSALMPGLCTSWPRVVTSLPSDARVLGLVDRQPHAIAEAGALGDADVGSDGRCHRLHSRRDALGSDAAAFAIGVWREVVYSCCRSSCAVSASDRRLLLGWQEPAISAMIRSVPAARAVAVEPASRLMRERERLADADPDLRGVRPAGATRKDPVRSRDRHRQKRVHPIAWPGGRRRTSRASGGRRGSASPPERCRSDDPRPGLRARSAARRDPPLRGGRNRRPTGSPASR